MTKYFDAYQNAKPTPIQFNLSAWDKYLSKKPKGERDFNFVSNGCPLWFITHGKDEQPTNLNQKNVHYFDNWDQCAAILDKFTQELLDGVIVPTDSLPRFVCSSFTVPKKGKTGKYDAYRVVRNGSFKTNATTSINQWIDPEKCKMH